MPVPTDVPLLRVRVGGDIGGDVWSTGAWFACGALSAAPSQAEMDAAALTILNLFDSKVWSGGIYGAWNTSGVNLKKCQLWAYMAGALVASGGNTKSPVAGTGTAPQPAYCSQVLTLLTARAGRSGRGRMYMPMTGVAPSSSNLQWTTATLGEGKIVDWIHEMSSSGGTDLPGTPALQMHVVSIAHGFHTEVIAVKADSIPDTQHGRNADVTPFATRTTNV